MSADIALVKNQIEAQLAEYENAVAAYAEFMSAWHERNDPAARRLKRFKEAAAKRESAI